MKHDQVFTLSHTEISKIVMFYLQGLGKLPKSSTGRYNVKTEVNGVGLFNSTAAGYEIIFSFKE